MFKKIWKFLNRDVIDVYRELFKKDKKVEDKVMENKEVLLESIIEKLEKLENEGAFLSYKNKNREGRPKDKITAILNEIDVMVEDIEKLSNQDNNLFFNNEFYNKCNNSIKNVETKQGYKSKLEARWKILNQKKMKQEEIKKEISNSTNIKEKDEVSQKINNSSNIKEFENITKQLESIQKQLNVIEKENLDIQGREIANIADNSNSILDKLKTFKIPSLQEIKRIFTESNQKLETSISNISNSMPKDYSNKKDITASKEEIKKELQSEISKISNKIKSTQTKTIEDITFNTNNKFEELDFLKELGEDLESVPADIKKLDRKLLSIDEKLNGLSLKKSKNKIIIPNKKVIDDLSTYMEDGLKHLVNISKTHVAQSEELEEFKKEKWEYENKLQKIKEETTQRVKEETEKEINIKIIKKIVEDFPSKFEEIKSVFNDYLSKEFEVDEELNVTNDNKNELSDKIKQPLNINIKYKIIKSAILLENEVLIKAEVKVEEIKEDKNQEEAVTNG